MAPRHWNDPVLRLPRRDWRYLAIIPLVLFELLEIQLWLKLRNVRSTTGTEALIGARARVINDCDPVGSVGSRGSCGRRPALRAPDRARTSRSQGWTD